MAIFCMLLGKEVLKVWDTQDNGCIYAEVQVYAEVCGKDAYVMCSMCYMQKIQCRAKTVASHTFVNPKQALFKSLQNIITDVK